MESCCFCTAFRTACVRDSRRDSKGGMARSRLSWRDLTWAIETSVSVISSSSEDVGVVNLIVPVDGE